jgi:hypothetical protein|tara:strand:- start:382 stop:978 length:597 start_codon:yes stop_codon:yes gene_type:complete
MAHINHIDIVLRDNVSPTLFRFVVPDTTKGLSIKNIVGYPWSADSGIIFAGRDISRDRRTLNQMDPTEDEFILRVIPGRHADDDPGEPMGAKKKKKKKTKKKKKKKMTKKKKMSKGAIPIRRSITKVKKLQKTKRDEQQRLIHHPYSQKLSEHAIGNINDMDSLLNDDDVTVEDTDELNFRGDQLRSAAKIDNYLAEE